MQPRIEWTNQFIDPLEQEDVVSEDNIYEEDDSSQTLINTPMGLYNVDNSMNPYSMFKMWMADCNFDITQTVKETLESTTGVEVLIPISRYKIIVGIGQLFNCEEVKSEIEYQLCGENCNLDPEISQKIDQTKADMNAQYKYWVVYVFPNGEIQSFGTNEIDDSFIENYALIQDAQELSHGIIIESDDGLGV